jgi:hypothetical protein
VEYLIILALDVFRARDKYHIIQLLGKADKKLLDKLIVKFDKEGKLRARYKEILAEARKGTA